MMTSELQEVEYGTLMEISREFHDHPLFNTHIVTHRTKN